VIKRGGSLSTALTEVFNAAINSDIAETGGAHNQKGIEFQKNWAIVKMFSLRKAGLPDFLFLFEAVQDVAILNSSSSPTAIEIYQVKKKDRSEWTWSSLTNLHVPSDPVSKSKKSSVKKTKPLAGISTSPVGKLFAAVASFKELDCTAGFVSNAGCDINLSDGGNAATSLPVAMSALPDHFKQLLQEALASVQKEGQATADLSRLKLEKVELPVDGTQTYTIGLVHNFLADTSPQHAGQARSFVESLLAKLGPLGAKTAKATSIEDMKARHGYSSEDFNSALGDLEQTLDMAFFIDNWLNQLTLEGLDFVSVSRIRMATSGIYRRMVTSTSLPGEPEINAACAEWLSTNPATSPLLSFLNVGVEHLQSSFQSTRTADLQAHFLIKAIESCAGQI